MTVVATANEIGIVARSRAEVNAMSYQDFNFPFEGPLHEVFPGLHAAQNAYMAQIDSLRAPDRQTHELIRLVCTVIRRNRRARRSTPEADWLCSVAAIGLSGYRPRQR